MEKEKNSEIDGQNNTSDNAQSCSCPENICYVEENSNRKNHKYDARNFFESYRFAVSGLKLILKNERNFRIQIVALALVVVGGLILGIGHSDWVALALVAGLVLISEAFNSVIEAVCDTVSKEYKVNIRYAKDVSAGAVLVSSIASAVTGLIIFWPYLWNLLKEIANIG
ncbi:diacylglycerol kinase family protein [Candidatus Dojkabacteria bacterium]|nr:diacylglycerol kinase family protein [Candidatus Dojkabacteria bacterium]